MGQRSARQTIAILVALTLLAQSFVMALANPTPQASPVGGKTSWWREATCYEIFAAPDLPGLGGTVLRVDGTGE